MYAFGEIVLVVIGILIALSINSWDSNRKTQNDILNYRVKIIKELEENAKIVDYYINNNDTLIQQSERTQRILNFRNIDSLKYLPEVLGATATAWKTDLTFPIIDQFMEINLLKHIDNDTTQLYFKYLKTLREGILDNNTYVNNQYANSIEPIIIKHVNYSRTALPQYRANFVVGGPNVDYESLFDNLELWNVVILKHETLVLTNFVLKRLKEFLEKMATYLKRTDKEIF